MLFGAPRSVLLLTAVLLSSWFVLVSPASAGTATLDPKTGPNFELPFACGETWRGSSRAWHTPSKYAIDFNAPGDDGRPVLASAPGVVSKVVFGTTSYGIYVVIDHGNGVSTLYAHLKTTWMSVGMSLDQGTPIGLLGTTGNSTSPHLHFEERLNGAVVPAYFGRTPWVMGTSAVSRDCPDTPIVGDWNGNGISDVGVVRRTPSGTTVLKRLPKRVITTTFGQNWDRFVTGDWNADQVSDLATRAPGATAFTVRHPDGTTSSVTYGTAGSVPITGDWNADARSDLAVWRADVAKFSLRVGTATKSIALGAVGDLPVTGDWNGDGRSDVGAYTPRTGTITMRAADGRTSIVVLGSPGSLPVTGDWNGDQITDLGVWDPKTAVFTLRWVPKGTTVERTKKIAFGTPR